MPERKLTRRAVLGAGAGALLGFAVARWPTAALAGRRSRGPQLQPPDCDVWASSLEVTGEPADVALTSAGRSVATAPGGEGFQAQVPVGPAATTVTATDPVTGATTSAVYVGRVLDRPTAVVSVSVDGQAVSLDATASQPGPYLGAPIAAIAWRTRDGSGLGSGGRLTLPGPWQDGEHYVVATVTDANGRSDDTTVVFVVAGGIPAAVDPATWQAQWVQSAIVYGAVPPLFGQPPLQAVTASLDRLAALGVNVLWLAPIFATVEGDYGYAVTDHFSVRSDYGDLSDLQALVATAHAHGMKVILDLPLNDTSDRHPYYRQTREAGESSHYWDFYARTAGGRATHYFDWRNLPNLNYGEREVRTLAVEAATYWLRTADIDGFRCDAAWGVQERAPGFWTQWCTELKRIRPDLLLLAESSARESWPGMAGFSAAYDWTEQLGTWAWQDAFSKRSQITSRLTGALLAHQATRPFRFLENNDTGARFITRYRAPTTRAAAALLLALPGIPCLFTGQEVGAEFQPYRRQAALDFSHDPAGLEDLYRDLIQRRLAMPDLATGALEPVGAMPASDVLAFTVSGANTAALVAVNFSGRNVSAVIDGGAQWGGSLRLDVPAWSSTSRLDD